MYYAGIDIGGTAVKMGILDSEKQELVLKKRIPTGKLRPEEMARVIGSELRALSYPIAGAGAVTAGRVYPEEGYVDAGNLEWWHVPLGQLLSDAAGMPIKLDNDVQGALFGEWKMGVCRDVQDAVYIALGTGIGGAFLINGKLYRGKRHDGGELGHMITHADGEACACGGCGCFERYASAAALTRMSGGVNPQAVFDRAAKGDAAMQALVTRYIHELAIGVSSISSIFRPEMIVLGGGMSEIGNALLDPLMEELRTKSPSIPRGRVPDVRLAALKNEAGLIGAALMAEAAK